MMANKTLRILVGTAVALSVLVGFGTAPAAAQSVPEVPGLPGDGDTSVDANVSASADGIVIDLDIGPGNATCDLGPDALPTEPGIPNASDSPCSGFAPGVGELPGDNLPGGGVPGAPELPGGGLPL